LFDILFYASSLLIEGSLISKKPDAPPHCRKDTLFYTFPR
jgi:hypothetical protein